MNFWLVLLVLCMSSLPSCLAQNCTEIHNCTQCLETTGCAYCASNTAVGCFPTSLSTYCSQLGGTLNSCSATGTECGNYYNCDSCKGATTTCQWCRTEGTSGYCFGPTLFAPAVCGALSGTLNAPCDSGGTTGGSTTSGGSTTGTTPINDYAIVDINAKCESFSGSQCVGTIFYNVFVNETYDQDDMSKGAEALFTYSGIPGVTNECRDAGTLLNCAQFFQPCEKLSNSNNDIKVSIPPCKSLCTNFNDKCRAILEPAGMLLNCDEIDPRTGTYRYAEKSITYEYNGNLYEFSCNDMVPSADSAGWYPNRVINGDFETIEANDLPSYWIDSHNESLVVMDTSLSGDNTSVLLLTLENSMEISASIYQTIVLNRETIVTIRIGGESKAVGVYPGTTVGTGGTDMGTSGTAVGTGGTDMGTGGTAVGTGGTTGGTQGNAEGNHGYGIYAELFYGDGSSDIVVTSFDGGNHDYQLKQITFTPLQPIQNVTLWVLLQNHTGYAYFDNIAFQEKIPDQPANQISCFQPLVYHPNWESVGTDPCVVPCPADAAFDNLATYRSIRPMYITLSFIGLFATFFIIVTWIIFPQKRKYPERLVVFMAIGGFIVSLHGVFQAGFTHQEATCLDEYTFLHSTNSAVCNVSGILLTLGASICLAWWLCLSISTWIMIKHGVQASKYEWMERYFHIGCWTFSVLATLIPAAALKFDSGFGSMGCWITTDHDSAYQFAVFYVPEGLAMVIALYFIGDSVRIIREITKGTEGLRATAGGRKKFDTYIRFFGFICLILLNVSFLFSYKFYTFANTDRWYAELENEFACRVKGGTYEECEGPRVNAVAYWFNMFGIGIESILIFLFFGFTQKNYQLWKELIINKLDGTRIGSLVSTIMSNKSAHESSHSGTERSHGLSRQDSVNSMSEGSLYSSTTEINKKNKTTGTEIELTATNTTKNSGNGGWKKGDKDQHDDWD